MYMCKPYVVNRIIDNQYEMYKNKLLYTALKNAKPITRTNWVENELPIINKKSILEIKDNKKIDEKKIIEKNEIIEKVKTSENKEEFKYG